MDTETQKTIWIINQYASTPETGMGGRHYYFAKELAKNSEVESIDICTGDWELLLKVRTKDQEEYYNLVKNVISRNGITKIKTLTSLKQVKTEFITL